MRASQAWGRTTRMVAVFGVVAVAALGALWPAWSAGADVGAPVTSTPDAGDPGFAEGKIKGYLWGDGTAAEAGWTLNRSAAIADDIVRLAGARGWPVSRWRTTVRISYDAIPADHAALIPPDDAADAQVQGWVAGVLEVEGNQNGLVYDCYRKYVMECPWKADVVRAQWERLGAPPVVVTIGTDIGSEGSRVVSLGPDEFAVAQAIEHYTSWARVPGGEPGSTPVTTASTVPPDDPTPATTVAGPGDGEPDSRVTWPPAQSTVRAPVAFSGTATADQGVSFVRIAIRKEATGQWLQPNGSFGSAFRLLDAVLADRGEVTTAWSYNASLPKAKYALSVRAVDGAGTIETSTPWVVFTVS